MNKSIITSILLVTLTIGCESNDFVEYSSTEEYTTYNYETTTSEETSSEFNTTSSDDTSFCGNGIIEENEECDSSSNCFNCIKDRFAFVTTKAFPGNLRDETQGVFYIADSYCKQYATDAGLDSPLSFKAWLSSSKESVRDRIIFSDGRYKKTNGEIIAIGDELFSGNVRTPINRDSFGNIITGVVWTGTKSNGYKISSNPEDFCNDWISSQFENHGFIGGCNSTNELWTFLDDELVNPTSCAFDSYLYCFQEK